jgi:hypothetical protein
LIQGVKLQEVKNVIKNQGGVLTEIFRSDWLLYNEPMNQVFQNTLMLNKKRVGMCIQKPSIEFL